MKIKIKCYTEIEKITMATNTDIYSIDTAKLDKQFYEDLLWSIEGMTTKKEVKEVLKNNFNIAFNKKDVITMSNPIINGYGSCSGRPLHLLPSKMINDLKKELEEKIIEINI